MGCEFDRAGLFPGNGINHGQGAVRVADIHQTGFHVVAHIVGVWQAAEFPGGVEGNGVENFYSEVPMILRLVDALFLFRWASDC